jgi:APA family basic amino acid/polyamine antiporter
MVYIREKEAQVEKKIKFFDLLMFGIGSTIGAGIFVLFGSGASIAGSGLIVSFIIASIISIFIAFNYAEMGSSIPTFGGSYTFVKEGLGGIIAFYIGWLIWFGSIGFAALSAIGFVQYFNYILPISFPDLFGAFIVMLFVAYNLKGTKETMRLQTIITIALMLILVLYIGFGFTKIEPTTITPLFEKGISSIFMATALIFVCFMGFEPITTISEEVKNPRHVAWTLIASIIIVCLFYIFITYVTIGSLPLNVITKSTLPLFELAKKNSAVLSLLFIGAILATLSSLNTALFAASRNLYALSRDGYMPKIFSNIHDQYKVPHVAILFSAFLIILFIATRVVEFVAFVSSFGFILAFSLVSLSLLILRDKRKLLPRPFKLPFYTFFTFLGILLPLILLPFLESDAIFVGFIWIVVGFFVYCLHTLGINRFRVAFAGMNVLVSILSFSLWYSLVVGFHSVKPLTKVILGNACIIISSICLIAAILFLFKIPERLKKFRTN